MNQTTSADDKRVLRADLRARRLALSAAERAAQSRALCERLAALRELDADTVLAYWPLTTRGEPDLRPLFEAWHRAGRVVALPRVVSARGEAPRMEAVRYGGAAHLAPARFGVMEPTGSDIIAPDDLGAILLPGLAADRDGYRLGYGGGFYDAFLSGGNLRAATVFACFDGFVLARLPREPHDRRADLIVTPRETIRARATLPTA